MKQAAIVLVLLSSLFANAQEKKIKGQIKAFDSIQVMDLQIININSGELTLSNEIGHYEINVKPGDSVFFNSANFEQKFIVVRPEDLEEDNIINLIEKEVTLNTKILDNKSIFYQQPDIYYYGEHVSAKTLKLPNQRKPKFLSKTTKFNNYVVLQNQTVSVKALLTPNISTIYKYFSGDLRRELSLLKMNQQDLMLDLMRVDFGDSFFINVIQIKKEEIPGFFNYCDPDIILELYINNKIFQLTEYFIIHRESYQLVKN
ncbi:hypothetical protein N9L20_06475 [Flavobacteriaceae bacterium]|nr:hypothetical protein [Flavobacteriaceae bacterium]